MRKMNFSYGSVPIQTINNRIKKKEIELKPQYQRGLVWPANFKDELVLSIVYNYPIGNVILAENKQMSTLDVVDGQQRLTTITSFINGEYLIKSKYSVSKFKEYFSDFSEEYSSILDDDEKEKLKILESKRKIGYQDFPQILKDDFNAYNIAITTISTNKETEVSEYFKLVQNQEKLRAGEIINSFNGSQIKEYLGSIITINDLSKIFNFNNERLDLERILANFFGLLDGELGLNTTDKKIIEYAEAIKKSHEVNEFINKINKFIELSSIGEKKYKKGDVKKVFLLLIFLPGVTPLSEYESLLENLNDEDAQKISELVDKTKYKKDILEVIQEVNFVHKR